MIDRYQQMTDAELEDVAADRARLRDTTFGVYEDPDGELVAAFRIPSPIEEGEWGDQLSARVRGADRRNVVIALLVADDLDRERNQ